MLDHAGAESKWKPFLRWAPALVWMAVIYCFSAEPNSNELTRFYFGDFNFWVRKMAHASEYAILLLLIRYGLAGEDSRSKFVIAFAATVAYAISDEIHQAFVPGRSAAVGDVVIDSAGALLCVLLLLTVKKIRRRA